MGTLYIIEGRDERNGEWSWAIVAGHRDLALFTTRAEADAAVASLVRTGFIAADDVRVRETAVSL